MLSAMAGYGRQVFAFCKRLTPVCTAEQNLIICPSVNTGEDMPCSTSAAAQTGNGEEPNIYT